MDLGLFDTFAKAYKALDNQTFIYLSELIS